MALVKALFCTAAALGLIAQVTVPEYTLWGAVPPAVIAIVLLVRKLGIMDYRIAQLEAKNSTLEERLNGQDKYIVEQMRTFAQEFKEWRHNVIDQKIGSQISMIDLRVGKSEGRLDQIERWKERKFNGGQ